jgi:hypothetical protein
MEILNPKIQDFYYKNPIYFEKANLMFIDLFNLALESNQPIKQKDESIHENPTLVNFHTNNINNDTGNELIYLPPKHLISGEDSEDKVELILNKLNPFDEVIPNTDENIFCDFIILKKESPNINIQTKNTKTNIKIGEIDYFVKSCKETKCNGILMSQHTRITGKNNFEIDIIDSNIIVFIHCVEHSEEKIKLGLDIIDQVYNKIKFLNMGNEITISKEILNEINKEYHVFISQKDDLNKSIKDCQVKLLNQLDDIKFNNLNKYLSTKFFTADKIGIHKCNLCNLYTSNTLKGMAAHKRGCKKKYPTLN